MFLTASDPNVLRFTRLALGVLVTLAIPGCVHSWNAPNAQPGALRAELASEPGYCRLTGETDVTRRPSRLARIGTWFARGSQTTGTVKIHSEPSPTVDEVTVEIEADSPDREPDTAGIVALPRQDARKQRPVSSDTWQNVGRDPRTAAEVQLPDRLKDAQTEPLVLNRRSLATSAALRSSSFEPVRPERRPPVTRVNFQDEPVETGLEAPNPGPGPIPLRNRNPAPKPNRPLVEPVESPGPPPAPAPGPDPQSAGPVPEPVHIPLVGSEPTDDIELTMKNGRVSLVARNAPIQSILNLLAQQQGLNLIAAEDVTGNVSVTLTNVPFEDALNAIVAISGCNWTRQRGIVLVTKVTSGSEMGADLQGKVVQVFPLNFVSAADLEPTIKGLLSPAGQSFISQTSPTNTRQTQELVVVEDVPASVTRIAQYIQQIDQAPRQVMIEVHVLQVALTDNTQHGVNWEYITKVAGSTVGLSTVGFASAAASPATFFSMSGDNLNVLIEALKTTTDTKTLASPKIIAANGQEARIQIGAKLGYFVTTTTQTSTLQNVNFLNTGVVLRVVPQISNDNRVLMHVRPEVSTGSISAAGLPQTNTTEAETTVMMDDGAGMVIGGLIKESDADTQQKVPILGDIWLIGRAFQKRTFARERSEIIIVLIPRIAPYAPDCQAADQVDMVRATTPIFHNGLQPTNRPMDPRLPDAINNPRRLRPYRLPSLFDHPSQTNPKPLRYYFPTEDEEMNPLDDPYCDPPVVNDVPGVQFPAETPMGYDDPQSSPFIPPGPVPPDIAPPQPSPAFELK